MTRPSIALLLPLLLLPACGVVTTARVTLNEIITPEQVTFITPGQTRFQDVTARLGAPDELLPLEEGGVAIYHFRDAKYTRINFGWFLRFVTPVQPDLVLSGAGLGTDEFLVSFDGTWVVRQMTFAHNAGAASFIPKPL